MRKTSAKSARELAALDRVPDHAIDTSDAPEIADWSQALVGRFYRPLKTPVSVRIDADVLAWLRKDGRGYQTRINAILRKEMERARPRRRAS